MRIGFFCLTLISTLMFSHVASAYKLIGARWSDSSIPIAWQLDESGVDDITDGSDVEEVKRAVKAWENVACSSLAFTEPTSLTGAREVMDDGVNKVFWIESKWAEKRWRGQEYGRNTLGLTLSKYYANKELFDVDIVFNGDDYTWSTGRCNYCSNCVDVFSIALHEFGHFFGLDHSNQNNAVMFPTYPNSPKQTFAQDDIDGICALYPAAHAGTGASGASCAQDGDCAASLDCALSTSGGRVCTATCSGPNATTCPTGYECRSAGSGYTCQPEVTPGSGEGETCSMGTPCQGDLWCVGYSQTEGLCRRPCQPNEPGACGPNFKCETVGSGSVCLPGQTQTGAAECGKCGPTSPCSSGLKCVVDGGQGRCRKACASENACGSEERCVSKEAAWVCSCPGLDPKLEGEGCSRTAECAENAVCIADGTSAGAACRTVCNPQSPACAEPKECVSIEDVHVCTHPAAKPVEPEPESPVADGCGCATPADLFWFTPFALVLRRRKRR